MRKNIPIKLFTYFICFLPGLFISLESFGIWLVEPYSGVNIYGMGERIEENGSSTTTTTYLYNTLLLGTKTGVHMFGVQLGIDYSLGRVGMETKTDTTDQRIEEESLTYSKKDFGIYLGYQWGEYRPTFTYFLSSSLTSEEGADSGLANKGSGWGIGLGYQVFPWLNGVFEYRKFSYSEVEDTNSEEGTTSALDPPLDVYEIVLIGSFPFDFF